MSDKARATVAVAHPQRRGVAPAGSATAVALCETGSAQAATRRPATGLYGSGAHANAVSELSP